jgi:hypothetical protein
MDPRIERYQYLGFKKSLRESTLENLHLSLAFWKDQPDKIQLIEEEITRRILIAKEEEEMKLLQPIVDKWNHKQLLKAMGVWTEDYTPPVKKVTTPKPTLLVPVVTTCERNTLLPPPPNSQMQTHYEEIEKGLRHGCGCLVRLEGEWKERQKSECDDCYYTYGDGAD